MISPILSNVFLHHVIDQWYTEQVRPRLQGPSTLVRFCDDFVMCFTHKTDAERVRAVLAKRLGKFGLQLHPEKTRLVDFRPWRSAREQGATLPTTFNFLGFTHVWGKSRKGNAVVRQLTAKDRACALAQGGQSTMQADAALADPGPAPTIVPDAEGALRLFWHHRQLQAPGPGQHHQVRRLWRKWLSRRSTKNWVAWDRFTRMLERFALPLPRIVHPYTVG